jgi:hypothetical protein
MQTPDLLGILTKSARCAASQSRVIVGFQQFVTQSYYSGFLSYGNIARMPEIVGTFVGTETRDEGANSSMQPWDGACSGPVSEGLTAAVGPGLRTGRFF